MRLVVIGGVAAGTKAASRAKRVSPGLDVTIYQEEPEVSIGECGLPYFLSRVVEKRESLVARTPEKFAEGGIQALTRHRVERLDPERKRFSVRDLSTGEDSEDDYDRLIFATGASAVMPPLPGTNLEGVFNLRFLTDADAIKDHVQNHSPKRAVVAGAGYIGLEVAENLAGLGMEVTLVEALDRAAVAYDTEVSRRVEQTLAENGVLLLTDTRVEELKGEDGLVNAVSTGDRELPAELVVLGVGVRPHVELAKEAGVEMGKTGAIRVDRGMKTNLPDVWAAGDCVETVNLISGESAWVPLGDTANQMGRVAGTNAALGEESLEFPGVLGTGIFKVFELGVSKTGLSEQEAQEAGFETVAAEVEAGTRAGYYPGGERIFLKLIAEPGSGRLLGAQSVGGSADKFIEVCATALWGGLTVEDLVNLDLAYAPPFGPTLSPVIQAASVLEGRLS
jgi:NADPH-dependent 2,4-dienoyl-CoA reductase/sulfur reductase-like enzyme